MSTDVLIVGGGLAGLCCAKRLHQRQVPFLLLDASDAVGGRIRTDRVEGFNLDHGFQVFLTSYPEARQVLDYESLDLQPFLPGALVRYHGRFHRLIDPWRRPFAALGSALSPIGSLADKLRVGRFRARCTRGTVEDQLRTAETTALQMLQDNGFSAAMIDRFFRPFLGGIFLDPTLQTSSRILRFVFRMFAQGDACLPARGMEAIPQQLRSHLPTECVQLHTRVAKVEPGGVILESGVRREARHIVLAVDCRSAAQLLGSSISSDCRGVTCLYFASQRPPVDQPILVLNGERDGLVNNLCVPTVVAPTYGPSHRHLVSATVLGVEQDDAHLCSEVRRELTQWFGSVVNDWRHLRTYRIPHALPDQGPPALTEPQRAVRWQPGIYVCGDHRDTASIQGAMLSGRRAAEAVLEDLHG